MRLNSFIPILGIAIALAAAVTGIFYAYPMSSRVQTPVEEIVSQLLPVSEQSDIDAGILNKEIIGDLEAAKLFGTHPVAPDSSNLNRSNPFEGI